MAATLLLFYNQDTDGILKFFKEIPIIPKVTSGVREQSIKRIGWRRQRVTLH